MYIINGKKQHVTEIDKTNIQMKAKYMGNI